MEERNTLSQIIEVCPLQLNCIAVEYYYSIIVNKRKDTFIPFWLSLSQLLNTLATLVRAGDKRNRLGNLGSARDISDTSGSWQRCSREQAVLLCVSKMWSCPTRYAVFANAMREVWVKDSLYLLLSCESGKSIALVLACKKWFLRKEFLRKVQRERAITNGQVAETTTFLNAICSHSNPIDTSRNFW